MLSAGVGEGLTAERGIDTAYGGGVRIRAPRLTGTWLTGGPPTPGSWVLLHFFTAGCINCRHAVAELSGASGVAVVGVHSPKFAHETGETAARSSVARLGITHPVLHDPALTTWDAYAVKAWPTLTLVDPDGYVVRQVSGEGHVASLLALAGARPAVTGSGAAVAAGVGSAVVPGGAAADLRPGGLSALPDGGVLVTVPGSGELVALDAQGAQVRRYGGFHGPQGVHVDPGRVDAAARGTAWVADTGSHRVLRLDLATGEVQVVAGTGQPWRPGDPREGPGVNLSAPWAITRWQGALVVALAGTHQLVTVQDAAGTESGEDAGQGVRVLAGTGREGLFDGPAREAVLAQPSGLAAGPDGLWFVDAESSALRHLSPDGTVTTTLGTGLFSWGSQDGGPEHARLQHPQGVTVLTDGRVVVADTYNGALRLWDAGVLRTVVQGLEEPVAVLADGTGLWVAGDRVERLPLPGEVC